MRVPVVLHAISGYDQDVLDTVAVPTVKGLSRCISHTGRLRNEITISPDFWSILQRLHQHEEAAPLVFELLESIVHSMPHIVTADNYESAVALANDFVSAGHVGSIDERQRDAHTRRNKGVKQPKPRYDHLSLSMRKKTKLIYEQRKPNRFPRYQSYWLDISPDWAGSHAYQAVPPRRARRLVLSNTHSLDRF